MKYKIQRTEHAKLTQGLLRLCMTLARFFYEPYDDKNICRGLLGVISRTARETTFLRRNTWEPLLSAYNILQTDDRILIESIHGKQYLEFEIVEVAEEGGES